LNFDDKYLNFDKYPSPDCRENPFLKKKDCNGKLEIASKINKTAIRRSQTASENFQNLCISGYFTFYILQNEVF